MPGGAYTVYASDVAEAIQGPGQKWNSTPFGTTNAGTTPYMPVVAPLGMNLAGILVFAQVTIVASGASTALAGADKLDLCTNGYEVTNAVGGAARCKTITRLGVEEAERIYLASPTTTVFSYPRAAPTAVGGAGTTTENVVFFVPASGGQAANIRFSFPGKAAAYTTPANITSTTVVYALYAVPTLATFQTSYSEVVTPSLASGQNELRSFMPDGMAPDFVEIIGVTWGTSSTTVSKVVVEGQGGIGITLDYEDSVAGNAAQTLFPCTTAANQTNILLNLHKQRADRFAVTLNAALSAGFDILFCELDAGAALTPTPSPVATPAAPLASNTASAGPGGSGVQPNRGSGAIRPVGSTGVARPVVRPG